jgi:hypothetical protein
MVGTTWQPELKGTWSATCAGSGAPPPDGAARAGVMAILLSPRGRVAAATPSGVFLFDGPPSFAPRRELRGQHAGLTAAAFGGKGTDVVAGGADGFLKWWQVDSGEELCSTQFPLGDGQQAGAPAIPEVACSKAGFVAAVSGRWGPALCCCCGRRRRHGR